MALTNTLSAGEIVALAIAGASGVLIWAALGAAGFAGPIGLFVAWLVLVPLEYALSDSERTCPDTARTDGSLLATFELKPLLGPLSMGMPAVCLAGLVGWALPVFLDSQPLPISGMAGPIVSILGSGTTFVGVMVGLIRVGGRDVDVRIDATTRTLVARRNGRVSAELHLPEIAAIRHESGALLVEHAHGVEAIDLSGVDHDQLDWVCGELDDFARELGADRDVRKNRLKAQRALASARPTRN